jgi:hypothetical protein
MNLPQRKFRDRRTGFLLSFEKNQMEHIRATMPMGKRTAVIKQALIDARIASAPIETAQEKSSKAA